MLGGSGSIFGSESPKKDVFDDRTDGTGKYPAQRVTDPTLENHTLYVPKTPPPADVKLPVLIFGNGGCGNTGSAFTNLLTEIASHGYIAIANGPPASNPGASPMGGSFNFSSILSGLSGLLNGGSLPAMRSSSITQMTQAVDWVTQGGAAKYGNIDTTKIAAGGQSCGGLQAYSASYHDDRIKQTIMFNSGVLEDSKVYLLKELKYPVAYFIGGPKDIAYANVCFSLICSFIPPLTCQLAERDYINLPEKLPAIKLNLDAGHIGTYYSPHAGKFGNATVAFLNWVFKDDMKAKAMFLDLDSQLRKDNWNISAKNWP